MSSEDRAWRWYHLAIAIVLLAIIGIDGVIIVRRKLAAVPITINTAGPGAMRLQLDPDVASVEALSQLDGLSIRQAQAIVTFRNQHREAAGQERCYRRLEDLDSVPGIGPKTLVRIRDYLCFPRRDITAPTSYKNNK